MLEKELHSLIDKRIENLGYQVVAVKYIKQANTLQVMIDFRKPEEFIPKEVQDARFALSGERAERTEEYVSTRVHEKAKMGSLKSEGYIGTKDCVRVSNEISSMLQVEEVISRNCAVEVSSPGLDRPLVRLEDFARYKGHKIKLAMKTLINGVKKCNAVVLDVIDSFIVFGLYNEQKLTVELKDIESAKLSLDDMQLFKTKKEKL